MKPFKIEPNVKNAWTLNKEIYTSDAIFERLKEQVFASSWQYIADAADLETDNIVPVDLLPGVLNEPLLIVRDSKTIRCLSNVCTHRGSLLANRPLSANSIKCPYHGRCFDLDGTFKSMPAFEKAEKFPASSDNLSGLPLENHMGLLFTNLSGIANFESFFGDMNGHLDWLSNRKLKFEPSLSKEYFLDTNWALYIDNYLEGLHIPFVHRKLNAALDFSEYQHEIHKYSNVQIAVAKEGEPHFTPPQSSHDAGQKIYAYYYWVFPNLMFNYYPWGVSFNFIQPESVNTTRINFRAYMFENPESEYEINAIDETELEDEEIIRMVQKGVQSRFYSRGRFSPSMEKGVHHFHSLLAESMA